MVEAKDLFAHALKLREAACDDLGYRTVIERAYYSAYHSAVAFEERLPVRSNAQAQTGSHDLLLQRLERPNTALDYGLKTISQYIAVQMRMFKGKRELATYQLDQSIYADDADTAIKMAKDILEECALGQKKIAALITKK